MLGFGQKCLSFRMRSYHQSHKILCKKDGPVFCQNYRIWMCCFAKVNQLEYSPWLYLFTCTANEMMENSFVNTSKFGMSESGPFAKIIIIKKIKSKALSKPRPHEKNFWSHWLHGSQHFTLLWVHWQWAESYYHYSPQFKIWNIASVSLRASCHVSLRQRLPGPR